MLIKFGYTQSEPFKWYVNPVIPGDHPDPTLTRIGSDFYTSGSSFNPTPKIYHSTDLVHWEVIAQPVSAAWNYYGDTPGGGIWGGHMVFYGGKYWHYFGKGGGSMYFATAAQPAGPWSSPIELRIPAGMSGLGVDNSIFIDDDTGKWYLLTKNGRENNHIVELGSSGQPTNTVLDLTWLNPDAEGNPYGWAEGPVMWKYNGYYYYSFAEHLAGKQYVMRSDTLTGEESAWTIVGDNIFSGTPATYNRPNHISPVVMLDDGTSWTIAHSYHKSSGWYAHGRQGLLCQVTYNDQGFPVIQYPPDNAVNAPDFPDKGIPWMVPRPDLFDTDELDPCWSFLGYKPQRTWSLTDRSGWLHLMSFNGDNTIIQNDGEHNYSLITRVDHQPASAMDEAGLWIINGPETHQAKVFSSKNDEGLNILAFEFGESSYVVENNSGPVVWLKLVRNNHLLSGSFSSDGAAWTQIGEVIDAKAIDAEQSQFNDFTGNQQGLYVKGAGAYFDLYIYRDAYTPMMAECPANQYGTSVTLNRIPPSSLDYLGDNDWAMYAGIEFGNEDYRKQPDSISVTAASASQGGVIEVWLDSLDTGTKIAECKISNTGAWDNHRVFSAPVLTPVSGCHDVYLKFKGTGSDRLFRIQWLTFTERSDTTSTVEESHLFIPPAQFELEPNYPNPFNPETNICFTVPETSHIALKIYDRSGAEVVTLFDGVKNAGRHTLLFDGHELTSGLYFCQLNTTKYRDTIKLLLLK